MTLEQIVQKRIGNILWPIDPVDEIIPMLLFPTGVCSRISREGYERIYQTVTRTIQAEPDEGGLLGPSGIRSENFLGLINQFQQQAATAERNLPT